MRLTLQDLIDADSAVLDLDHDTLSGHQIGSMATERDLAALLRNRFLPGSVPEAVGLCPRIAFWMSAVGPMPDIDLAALSDDGSAARRTLCPLRAWIGQATHSVQVGVHQRRLLDLTGAVPQLRTILRQRRWLDAS
ncbi:hypothetical protein Noca_4762 (plasmid) [Nocardioides sp. JS614]|nr:hypothetical protein Noca_4762 [Nocardioides sp. JS614]